MKKLFSLVALAGMFMLMSFVFKTEKNQEKRDWCDSVNDACTDAANDTMSDNGYSEWEANCYYLTCITMNGC